MRETVLFGDYLNNLDRPRGLINGLKGEFALSALKLPTSDKTSRLTNKLFNKAEQIMSQQGLAQLFYTAIISKNTPAVHAIWQLHKNNIAKNATFEPKQEKSHTRSILTTHETSHALSLAFEHGNKELAQQLLDEQENWLYLIENPKTIETMTGESFYHEFIGLPVLFGLQNYQKNHQISLTAPKYQPNPLERLAKTALDKYFGVGCHYMSLGDKQEPAPLSIAFKQPKLDIFQGGRANTLKTHMEDCIRRDKGQRPTHLKLVK